MTEHFIGVDPGARETGIVLRRSDDLLHASVITRTTHIDTELPAYLREILGTVSEYVSYGDASIIMESLVAPVFHATDRVIRPTGLIGTAFVIGAILADFPNTTLIAPAGYGSAPLVCYPSLLVGAREKQGRGRLRHLRSAWDISYATASLLATA